MKYIIRDPKILNGTAVVVNTRIPVSKLLDYLRNGYSLDEICDHYPQLDKSILDKALSEISADLDKDLNAPQTSSS